MFRQERSAQTNYQEPDYYKYKPYVQVMGLPLVVAFTSYPLEIVMSMVQMGHPVASGFIKNPQLLRGVYFAIQGSYVKNTSLASRDYIENLCGSKKPRSMNEEEMGFNAEGYNFQKIMQKAGLGAVVAGIDTVTGIYSANRRVHATFNINVPKFKNLNEVAKYAAAGFNPRFLRNFSGVTAYMATDSLELKMRPYFGEFSAGGAIAVTSVYSGVVTIFFDTLWKASVLAMNLEKFSTPPATSMMKQIYRKNKLPGFFRGTPINIFNTFAIFGTMYAFENYFIKRIFPDTDKKDSAVMVRTPLAPRFFKPVVEELKAEEPQLDNVPLTAKRR